MSLFEKPRPVRDAADKIANVDVIKSIRGEGPVLCAILDLAAQEEARYQFGSLSIRKEKLVSYNFRFDGAQLG